MKSVIDTHVHTYVSGHAYSTLVENIEFAEKNGLEILAVTDHGPKMPGGPHPFYFNNLRVIPREIKGIMILRGCEANIINFQGDLDISEETQERLDLLLVSLHDVCIKSGTKDDNTMALIKAMDNDRVDIICHAGNPSFKIDQEKLVLKAKEKNKIIEINNSSFKSRPGCEENCLKLALLCKEHGVKVVMGSDAHFCTQVGILDDSKAILEAVNMPEEFVMNTDKNKIIEYLKSKGKLKDI